MWATTYKSYTGGELQVSTTITSQNVSSGSAGVISWTGTSCTYSDSRVNIAANGSITFTASSGYNITKIVIVSGSSSSYYGTWTSSPSVTPSSTGGTTTFDGLNANSVTVTTSTAFRCTSASSISIHYEAAAATALSVKTAPTKINYKVGETLDLTGLVLDATIGGNHVDVTTGYTASPANGATLNDVGAQTITFTYGGQNCNQTIHVGALESIAVTTPPTKTAYDEGQSFDPAGMVVKATYSDEEDTPTEWQETITEYTYSPTSPLGATDTEITISFGGKNTTQAITVTAGVPYTVSFNAGTGSCATASLAEASFGAGVTLPTATISLSGWSFAGWATSSTENTEVAPTLYAAGDTYHPTDNITLYAVYLFTDTESGVYKRATSVEDLTSAASVVIVNGTTILNVTNSAINKGTAPSETNGKITAPSNAIFTLSGNNTDGFTLTNSGTLGATSNNANVSLTTANNLWKFEESSNGTNNFVLLNKAWENNGLQYYSGNFKVYTNNNYASQANFAMKMYVPSVITTYNSNPAAIVNPTIAFTTAGDKNLYVQDDASYTNVAIVTGIDKEAVYTSSDETVATVSNAGVVTALKAGETTITAKVAAEIGVNTEASTSYNVTVKDAKTIAGLKAITDASSSVNFTADLTDAIVTYVKDNYAYIQDASGAVYASCGSSLTAGKKINGAVTGSIKASYKIDEITAIELADATITDGVIPSAEVKTVAQLLASGTTLEGQLVQVSGATVTASLESGNASGGKITDDGKTSEINLYAPASNIEALKDAEGTFTGFISYYNNSTYRLNIYEQSQITFTKNAPTEQPLTFAEDAIELDEDTDEYNNFTGQTVGGAKGSVTYALTGDAIGTVDASTGTVTLNGSYGTATITATASATSITEGGVTTPYIVTEKSYTVTTYPRYTSTFSINGAVSEVRQATHGAEITVPTPASIGEYYFMGWKETTGIDTPTDEAPTMVTPPTTPTSNVTYYAVYAVGTGSPVVEHTSTFTVKQASAPSSPYESDGSSWTWSNVTFANGDAACINSSNGSVTFTLPSGGKAKSLKITRTSNQWAGACSVVLKDASNNTLNTFSLGSSSSATYNFTSTYDHSASYSLTNSTSKNAWTDNIEFKYETGGISYSGYCTSLPVVGVNVAASGYTTYASAYALDFENAVEEGSDDKTLKAYVVSEVSNTAVTLTEVTSAPASTGVVLKGTASTTYTIPVIASANAVGTNLLTAVVNATTVEANTVYVVSGGKFCLYTGTSIPAGKAYLAASEVPALAGASMLDFDFNETTGIKAVENSQWPLDGDFYNMNGQRVAQPTKGLYIVNGRKVVIK